MPQTAGCARTGRLVSYKPRKFSCSFFRRKSQRRPRGENDRETAAHLAERSRKTTLFRTIVPGARCATASSSDIFTSRKQAGLRPAKNTRLCNPTNRLIIALEFVSFRRPLACRGIQNTRPPHASVNVNRLILASESAKQIPARDDEISFSGFFYGRRRIAGTIFFINIWERRNFHYICVVKRSSKGTGVPLFRKYIRNDYDRLPENQSAC